MNDRTPECGRRAAAERYPAGFLATIAAGLILAIGATAGAVAAGLLLAIGGGR